MNSAGVRDIAALVLLPGLFSPQAQAAELLRIASDDWCPYVCATEHQLTGGFLVELVSQAMASQGYHVEPILLPLSRAMASTESGRVEGVYAPPIDARLLLSAPLAYSRACFYTRTDERWSYQGLDSLRSVQLGAIPDYGYDDGPMDAYIRNNQHEHSTISFSYGEKANTNNLQRLLGGRFPVLLEHAAVMQHLSNALGVQHKIRLAGCLEQSLPLTIGFAKADIRTGAWLQALRLGLQKASAAGALQELQRKYQLTSDGSASP
ncbi:MAG: transporter substrate-binding domain-containing protein [Pseudomonas sp.]|uniref:substrate-binding periplasmic protein n=1 Tax=Pseudomonas sp. TaxID=306 RepID=UPI003BB661DE